MSSCLMIGFTEVTITVHSGFSFWFLAGLWQLICNHGSSMKGISGCTTNVWAKVNAAFNPSAMNKHNSFLHRFILAPK